MIREHNRQSIRLQGFDYSQPGFYFVTICTQNHDCWFGEIKNNEMILNKIGQIAKQFWLEIPKHFDNTYLDEYIVMPNHVHGIIEIKSIDMFVKDAGVQHVEPLRTEPKQNQYQKIIPRSIGSIIRLYKGAITKNVRKIIPNTVIWQRNYYEHIVRDENDLNRIRNYIRMNPIMWELDRNNPINLKKR